MNMNKNKLFLCLLLAIFSVFLYNLNVYARCDSCTTAASSNSSLVAENPCGEPRIRKTLRFFGNLLNIAKIAIPLIIIIMGTFDFYKSVVDKDDKSLTKQTKLFLIRIVAGFGVFFIPTLVYALFNVSSKLNIVSSQEYKVCVDCLLDPTDSNKCPK